MLIRSSDGIHIVNIDCTNGISVCMENGVIAIRSFSPVDVCGLRIGIYDSKERALEVLDEICNAYISLNGKDRKNGFAYVKNGIYQMPEE